MSSVGELATSSIPANHVLRKPFAHGWRRELVFRTDTTRHGARSADCYYFTPAGKKLRSLREIQAALDTSDSGLEIGCFSLQRQLLGAGPPDELERQAGTCHSPGLQPLANRHRTKRRSNPRGRDGLTKGERRLVEKTLGNVLRKSKPGVRASPAAPAEPAAQRKLHILPAAGGQPRRTVMVVPPAQQTRIAVPAVQTNGSLPRGRVVLERPAGQVGTKLLKILTKGESSCAVMTDMPKRRLKMMVKGDPPSLAAATASLASADAVRRSAAAALRRLVTSRPWRLAVINHSGKMQTLNSPGRSHDLRREYNRLLRSQADTGDAPTQPLQIGRVRQYAACTLFCSRTKGTEPLQLPTLRCVGCCCLSHPACVGLVSRPDGAQADFVCLDCFDRLRRRPDRRLAVQEALCSPEDSPERPASPAESEVQEIVVVASRDESDALVAAAADRDWSNLITLGDSSGSDSDSVEFMPTMLWGGQQQALDEDSGQAGSDVRAPPSLVRGAGPPALGGRGPRPLLIAPPGLSRAPPPPPLQRAPAATPRTVLINRVMVSPTGAARAGPPVVSPATVSGGGQDRTRRHSGCKVRVTGPPALAGAAGSPPAPVSAAAPGRRSSTVVVVSPTASAAPALTPVRSINSVVSPASAAAGSARLPGAGRDGAPVGTYGIHEVSPLSGADPPRVVLVRGRGPAPRQDKYRQRNAWGAANGSTTRWAAQAPRLKPHVVKVAMKPQPKTNGLSSTVSVERPTAGPASTPAGSSSLTEGAAGRHAPAARRLTVVSVAAKQKRPAFVTPPRVAKAAVKTEPSPSSAKVKTERSPSSATVKTEHSLRKAVVKIEPLPDSFLTGGRLTRAGKRAAVPDTKSGPPVAKKRSWRAPDE